MRFHPIARFVLSIVFIFGFVASFAVSGQLGLTATGQQAQDEISYTMPPGWLAQAVQGNAELKAHYVLMSGGRPYAEMYLSQSVAPAGQTIEQVFEQGLANVRPQLQYYQARGNQMVTIAGLPAVAHEFSYMPAGMGVIFIARTYTLVSGSSVFTFWFQSTENYFASTQIYFGQVMASVRPVPKPAPAPVNQAGGNLAGVPANQGGGNVAGAPVVQGGGNLAGQPAVTAGGGGIVADDMGLNFDLPAGWKQVDDPAGAKYRCFDPQGNTAALLFILKPQETDGMTALFGGTDDQTLKVALNEKVEREYKSYQQYTPMATVNRQIGGYKGLVHDFTFLLNNRPVFYRWAVFVVPRKGDNPNVRVAPLVQSFGFLAMNANQSNEMQQQWNAVIDSMRAKGAAAAPAGQLPAAQGNNIVLTPRPKEQGGLPDLVPEEGADAGPFADPFGRFKITLPQGAVPTGKENNFSFFRMPARKTNFVIRSYQDERIGQSELERVAQGRRLNGPPSPMTVSGREAKVALYSGRDAEGENMVWVVARYENSGLIIEVSLPSKDYAAAKDWISALIRSVRF